jgi:outer membrane biosynthesis protein TonB
MPVERELSLDELPDRFAKMMMPKEPEKPKEKKPTVVAKAEEKVEEEKKEEPKASVAEKKAAMEKRVASKGLLKILGSQGSGGALEDVLGDSSSNSVSDALAGAGGIGVATADALAANQKGGGAGNTTGIGDLATGGAGNVNLGDKGNTVIRGRVADQAPDVDSKDVDREALARYVRSRKAAIQSCYEKELKRNPSLKGKVVVRFTITKMGRASEIGIEEDTMKNEAVGSCIKAIIRSWVFPFKPEDDVPVAYPFVFSAQ